MTQEEILDYNRRCAEFLGYTVRENGCYNGDDKLVNKLSFLQLRDLKFHSDWNWIHLVIEKINNTRITAEMNGIKNSITPYINARRPIIKGLLDNKKEAVVQVINQFLIWYNEQRT